jgi:hypothetical protein
MLSDYNTVGVWDILCSDGCQYRDSGLPGYDSVVCLTGADTSEESWRQQVQQKRWYPSTTVQDSGIDAWLDLEMGLLI